MKENIEPINNNEYFLDENGNVLETKINAVGYRIVSKPQSNKKWYQTTSVRDYITGNSDDVLSGRGARSLERAARNYQYLSEDFSRRVYSPKFMARKYDRFGGIDLDLIKLAIENAEKEYNSTKTKFESGEIEEKKFNKIKERYRRTLNNLNENYQSLYEVWHGKNGIPLVRTQTSVSSLPFIFGTIGFPATIIGGIAAAPYIGKALLNPATYKNVVLPILGTKVVNETTRKLSNNKYKFFGDFVYNESGLANIANDTFMETPLRFVSDMTNLGYWAPYGKISTSLFNSIPNWMEGKAYNAAGDLVGTQLYKNPKAIKSAENILQMIPQQHRYNFAQGVINGNKTAALNAQNSSQWFTTEGMPNPKTTFYSGFPINFKYASNISNYIKDFYNKIRFYGITPSHIKSAKSLQNLSNDLGIQIDMTKPWNGYNLNNISKELQDLSKSVGSLRGQILIPSNYVKFKYPELKSISGSEYESALNELYKQMDHAESWGSLYVPEIRINKERPTYFVDDYGIKMPNQDVEWIKRGYDLLDPNRPMTSGRTYAEEKALADKNYLLKLEEDAENWYSGIKEKEKFEQDFNQFRTIISKRFEHPFLQQFVYENPKYYYPLQQMKNDGLSEIEAYKRLIMDRNTLYRAIGLKGNTREEVEDPNRISKYALNLTRDAVNRSNESMVGYQRIFDEPNTGGLFFGDSYTGYGGPAFAYRRSDGNAQDINADMKSSPDTYFSKIFVKLQPEFDFSGSIETWWDKNPTLPRSIKNAPNQEYTFNTKLNDKIPVFDTDAQITEKIKRLVNPLRSDQRIYNPEQTVEGPVGKSIPFKIVDIHSKIGTLKSNLNVLDWRYNFLHDAYTDYKPDAFERGYVPYGFKSGGKLIK